MGERAAAARLVGDVRRALGGRLRHSASRRGLTVNTASASVESGQLIKGDCGGDIRGDRRLRLKIGGWRRRKLEKWWGQRRVEKEEEKDWVFRIQPPTPIFIAFCQAAMGY
jgi:hypothetical protein